VRKPPSTPAPAADGDPRLAWLRLGGLAVGILAALLIVAAVTGVSARGVRDWADGFGAAAPLVFIVVSASLTCALFPGPVLAAASGLLFGTALGFPVSLSAATLGASCAFLISRGVGLGAVEQVAGPRLQRVRGWIGRRVEMLTLAVLSQLRACNNWHRVAREWIYGDEPVTELGRLEAAFYAEHPPAAVLRGAA